MFAVFLILFLAFTPLAGIYFANKSSGSTGVTQNTTSKKPSTTKEEPKKQEVAPKTVEKRIETPAPVKAPEPVVAPTRIPEEDAPKPIVPKDEKPSTVSSSKSGTPTDSTSEEFDLPSKLHKHVIGTGGKIIKEIQTNHNVKIDLIGDENKMKIVSKDDNSANVANAFSAVRKALEEVGWFFENNEWVEKLAYDAIYKEWNIKIENEAKLMTKCFEDAKTNFEQGNKEEAKNLSTQGKVHQENMHKYKQECAQAVFDFL
jgi:type IV secretory pathway VirB10-like protein